MTDLSAKISFDVGHDSPTDGDLGEADGDGVGEYGAIEPNVLTKGAEGPIATIADQLHRLGHVHSAIVAQLLATPGQRRVLGRSATIH